MPETLLNITIKENSKITAVFSGVVTIWLDSLLNSDINFNVSLGVEGVGNKSVIISNYFDGGIAKDHYVENTFYLYYETGSLTAGTYNISVKWRSLHTTAGTNQLLFSDVYPGERTRSLLVQELSN
ncbi:MAG: hypothetical protein GY870_14825 [archaeon]|nr:hypothetical protein [archaeon]